MSGSLLTSVQLMAMDQVCIVKHLGFPAESSRLHPLNQTSLTHQNRIIRFFFNNVGLPQPVSLRFRTNLSRSRYLATWSAGTFDSLVLLTALSYTCFAGRRENSVDVVFGCDFQCSTPRAAA